MDGSLSIRQRSIAVKDDAWLSQVLTALIGAIAGVGGAVLVLWGKLREVNSAEQAKRDEKEAARVDRFVDLGDHLITDRSERIKHLEEKVDAHGTQMLTLANDVHLYKAQCVELQDRVALQTLRIQEQELKLEEQAETIEGLRKDNKALRQINRELMAQVRNDMQVDLALHEAEADSEANGGAS